MAMPYASTSAITCTLSSQNKPSSCFTHKSPFLVVKPTTTTTIGLCKQQHSLLHVRCQADDAATAVIPKDQQQQQQPDGAAADILKKKKKVVIPIEQRWMFLDDENDDDFTGPDIWNTTWYPKGEDHVNTEKTWYVVDATDKILGRLASTIAVHIRGKNLATYTPSVDMGAFVIVVNAEKVAVSGKKRLQKVYKRHSGRPGGMKVETFDQLQQRIPERIIEHAVRGMLPKGRLGRDLFTHLKVYKGPDHPHAAQKPIDLPIRDKRIQMVS